MPVAFITGASSGIGESLSRLLARRGYAIGAFARSADKLDALVQHIEAAGGKAMSLPGDVTIRDDLEAAKAKLEASLGPADLVIANAGVGFIMPVHKIDPEKTRQIILVNVVGAMQTIEIFLPQMLERGSGHIVGISSLAGYQGVPTTASYGASKAALTIYLESLRCELLPRGIHVTTVCPGFVETPMTAGNKKMPFLMGVEEAARRIADGIERRKRVLRFPLTLSLLLRLVQWLPDPVYEAVVRRM
jgi:short-subunit dehydrogenase